MTMQSYFWSGTGGHDIDAPSQVVRNRPRPALHVVVAHQHAVAVGDQPPIVVRPHLESELEARACELARPHEGADLLVEERRRAVGDVALGEDEPELLPPGRSTLRKEGADEVDSRRLEEAQELDVVHVLHRVEVAEAHALDHREPAVLAHGFRSGIWIRAIALTRNQNSVPADAITTKLTSTA